MSEIDPVRFAFEVSELDLLLGALRDAATVVLALQSRPVPTVAVSDAPSYAALLSELSGYLSGADCLNSSRGDTFSSFVASFKRIAHLRTEFSSLQSSQAHTNNPDLAAAMTDFHSKLAALEAAAEERSVTVPWELSYRLLQPSGAVEFQGGYVLGAGGEVINESRCSVCSVLIQHWADGEGALRFHCINCPSAHADICSECQPVLCGLSELAAGDSDCMTLLRSEPGWHLDPQLHYIVEENNIATFLRLQVAAAASPGQFLEAAFNSYHNRPCLGFMTVGTTVSSDQVEDSPISGVFAPVDIEGYSWLTYSQLGMCVRSLARGFASELGLVPGDKVAILGPNCLEWAATDFACAVSGLISVGVHTTMSFGDVKTACERLNVRLFVLCAPEIHAIEPCYYTSVLNDLCAQIDCLSHVLVLRFRLRGFEANSDLITELRRHSSVPFWDKEGIMSSSEFDAVSVPEGDIRTLLFTSGSSSLPKSVIVSSEAFRTDIESPYFEQPLISASFIPLSHSSDRLRMYETIGNGGRVGFVEYAHTNWIAHETSKKNSLVTSLSPGECNSVERLIPQLSRLKPSAFAGPPRIWNGFYNRFNVQVAQLEQQGGSSDEARLLAQKDFREVFGHRLSFAATGGAPISARVKDWVSSNLGENVTFMESYGTTETGGITEDSRVVPGVDVLLLDLPQFGFSNRDRPCARGEILVRSSTMIKPIGYYGDPELTKQSFIEGFDREDLWFRTGDIGCFDSDGGLTVFNRVGSVVRTKSGAVVCCDHIEALIEAVSGVSNVFVSAFPDFVSVVTVIVMSEDSDSTPSDWKSRINAMLRDCSSDVQIDAVITDDTVWSVKNGLLNGHLKKARSSLISHYERALREAHSVADAEFGADLARVGQNSVSRSGLPEFASNLEVLPSFGQAFASLILREAAETRALLFRAKEEACRVRDKATRHIEDCVSVWRKKETAFAQNIEDIAVLSNCVSQFITDCDTARSHIVDACQALQDYQKDVAEFDLVQKRWQIHNQRVAQLKGYASKWSVSVPWLISASAAIDPSQNDPVSEMSVGSVTDSSGRDIAVVTCYLCGLQIENSLGGWTAERQHSVDSSFVNACCDCLEMRRAIYSKLSTASDVDSRFGDILERLQSVDPYHRDYFVRESSIYINQRMSIIEGCCSSFSQGIQEVFHQYRQRPFLGRVSVSGEVDLRSFETFESFHSKVSRLGQFMMNSGLAPGSPVICCAEQRPELAMIDLACGMFGLRVTFVHIAWPEAFIRNVIHSFGVAAFVGSQAGLDRLLTSVEVGSSNDVLCICFDQLVPIRPDIPSRVSLGTVLGQEYPSVTVPLTDFSDVFTVLFSSGTSGQPKGIPFTQQSWISAYLRPGLYDLYPLVVLDYGSYGHGLNRGLLWQAFANGGRVVFDDRSVPLFEKVSDVEPSLLVLFPVDWTSWFVQFRQSLSSGIPEAELLSLFRDKLGHRLKVAASGGGPISDSVFAFLESLSRVRPGLSVSNEYGTTEVPGIASNGVITPGFDVVISDSGEILVKAPQMATSYWRCDAATADAFDASGYFHTGDMGEIDAETGKLSVLGRVNDFIELYEAGRSVWISASRLEAYYGTCELVNQILITGDRNCNFLVAIVVLASDCGYFLPAACQILSSTFAEMASRDSRPFVERVHEVVVVDTEWTIESGELTSSRKLRRSVILNRFADRLALLFGQK